MYFDFHTAGIFPNAKEVFDNKFNSMELVNFHDFGKEPFKRRITITITGLKLFNNFFILLKGEEKKLVLEYLMNKEVTPLCDMPCGVYKSLNTNIVTDITY